MASDLSVNSYSQIPIPSVTDISSKNMNMTFLSSSISQPVRNSSAVSNGQAGVGNNTKIISTSGDPANLSLHESEMMIKSHDSKITNNMDHVGKSTKNSQNKAQKNHKLPQTGEVIKISTTLLGTSLLILSGILILEKNKN